MPRITPLAALLSFALVSCGSDGGTNPTPNTSCTTPTPVNLPVGGVQLVEASRTGCLELSATGQSEEYLVVGYSGAGQETQTGISGGFELQVSPPGATPLMSRTGPTDQGELLPPFPRRNGSADAFHRSLRRSEAALVQSGAAALSPRTASRLIAPPVVGDQSQFRACATLACASSVPLTATARVVGEHGVIWVDNVITPGADQLTLSDLQGLASLFDDYLFPIDTTAFGSPSDIDGNQRIDIVITERVNQLTTDCSTGRVVGYFFGGDLIATHPGSNQREVFFAFAPRPAAGNCTAVTRSVALKSLPPVLIHELQHMISFNERVLRRGRSDEATWLNEGLSQFAEDLGQFLIPDSRCPASSSCFSQFASGNLWNAFDFMTSPDAHYLVSPRADGPTLESRGASWLFVRWLADHYSADTLRGTSLTRALTSGAATGAENVANATGVAFPTLVGEWLGSLWVDDLPGVPQVGRLRYRTWNFRHTFAANYPSVFTKPFPLEPRLISGTGGTSTGTLHAGSGRFLRVAVEAGRGPVQVRMTGSGGGEVSPALVARIAVVRTK